LADIVATRDAALRLASFEALAGLFLLVRRQDRSAAEFDALRLGVAPAPGGAVENAAALQLGRYAESREHDLGKVRGRIEDGSASDRIPAPAFCISRAMIKRSVVSRDRRSTAGMNTTSPGRQLGYQFLKLWPVGRGAGELLAEHLFAPGRLQLV
jgi:hypothetical protein